ncbi:MAG TPA: hypothetical protein VKM93_16550 [Terriglobia bacterium]|nr:hypothetical protein [Terriglobia bacterium]
MATTKTMPSLDLFELILDEAVEICQKLERLRSKLRRLKKGSEAYFDVMSDIAVANTVMNVKTASLLRERYAILDAMPD